MFAGFTSRCTRPASCAASSAEATGEMNAAARAGGRLPRDPCGMPTALADSQLRRMYAIIHADLHFQARAQRGVDSQLTDVRGRPGSLPLAASNAEGSDIA